MKIKLIVAAGVCLLLTTTLLHAECYNYYTGGDGADWLSGTITASDAGVADIQVCLQPSTWLSGQTYAYECTCTDESGNYAFQNETNPEDSCYTTYSWGGTDQQYCNWQSAACYQQCVNDDLYNWYVGQEFATEGYTIYATPPWGSDAAEMYEQCTIEDISIDFENSQSASCELGTKSNTLNISIVDQLGNPITSGLTLYTSCHSSYNNETVSSATTTFMTGEGTCYIGAYCSDWTNCDYGCISNQSVTISGENQTVAALLTAKANDSIVTGTVTGSDGSVLANASVSINSIDNSGSTSACYAYGWSTADSDGNYSIRVPAGNYSAWVNPPWTGDSSVYSAKQDTVALSASEAQEKDFILQKKDSELAGTISNSNGDTIESAWVSGWTIGSDTYDWMWAQSNGAGTFSSAAITDQRYNVSAYYWSNDGQLSPCPREGVQTARAPATDVNFTFDVWDHSTSIAFVDEDGNAITDVSGGVNLRLAETADDGYWCGSWVNMTAGSGSTSLAASTEYILNPYTWSANYDPAEASIDLTTGESGASSQINITMIPIDATISGNFVDESGNSLTLSTSYLGVYATRNGFLWKNCTASTSGFSCAVSAGTWCLGSWQDPSLGYSALALGADGSCVDVNAGATVTQNLTFLQNSSINVSVQDSSGTPLKWVWVEASPVANSEEGSSDAGKYFSTNGCSSGVDGTCTITAPAATSGTTYYLHAFRPWSELNDENLTLPTEVSVTATAGQSVTASALIFKALDGELNISSTTTSDASLDTSKGFARVRRNPVKNSSKALTDELVDAVYISCFSSEGAYAEATTDSSGTTTVKCTSDETWECIGVQLLDNDLYVSEAAEATCAATEDGGTDVNIALNFATAVPDGVSQSGDAGSRITLSLSDNFSATFPANSLGSTGENVSCSVQPDPIMPYQAAKRPTCFYGYDITCSDESGDAITQLESEATLCIPLCGAQLELLNLDAGDVKLTYRNTASDSYISLSNVTVDQESNVVCGKTNHLTEFVLVGNGDISGIDGDSEDAQEESERTGEAASGASSCGCSVRGQASAVDPAALILSWIFIISARFITRKRASEPKS